MNELFQERFRELPAFQKMLEQVKYCLENNVSEEEFATRMMLMADSPISWFTTCGNCSALMDENYAKYTEIEQLTAQIENLKEDLAYAENEARDANRELEHWEHMNEENRI